MPAAKACLPFPASPASRQAVRGGASARSRLGRVCKRGRWAVGACAPWGAGREGGPLQGRCGHPRSPPPESALPVSLVHSHGAVGPGEQVRSSPGPRRLIQAPGAHPGQGLVHPPPPRTHAEEGVSVRTGHRRDTRAHAGTHMHAPPLGPAHPPRDPSTAPGKQPRRQRTRRDKGAHALCGGRARTLRGARAAGPTTSRPQQTPRPLTHQV